MKKSLNFIKRFVIVKVRSAWINEYFFFILFYDSALLTIYVKIAVRKMCQMSLLNKKVQNSMLISKAFAIICLGSTHNDPKFSVR